MTPLLRRDLGRKSAWDLLLLVAVSPAAGPAVEHELDRRAARTTVHRLLGLAQCSRMTAMALVHRPENALWTDYGEAAGRDTLALGVPGHP